MLLKFILGIVLIIVLLFTYWHFRQKYYHSRHRADFLKIFGNQKFSLPSLEFGSSYGWPTFKVTFKTKNDLDNATKSRLTEDFKNCIKPFYGKKFDADIAIYFTSSDSI